MRLDVVHRWRGVYASADTEFLRTPVAPGVLLSPAMFALFVQQLRLRPARRLPIAFGWLNKRETGPTSGGCGRS